MFEFLSEVGDPRVKGWFLMDSFKPTALLCVAYLIVIYSIKWFMRNRRPFELKNFMFVYNLAQVVGTFYVFKEILTVAVLKPYSLSCEEVDYSQDPLAMRMLNAMWLYYISKLVDFIDTFVFALRKKDNQITFLHVFHHITVFPVSWIAAKHFGGGQTFFGCMLNSFVHTVMYTYYGLSSMGPSVQKYLWWKRYITQLQLGQFLVVMIHSALNMFMSECKYSKSFGLFYSAYVLIIASLFVDFYLKAYKKKVK